MTVNVAACPLCSPKDEEVLWSGDHCRVIRVDDSNFPGYCRVIWSAHQVELTDLAPSERVLLMRIVCEVESAVRETTGAEKINLASFGNVVPHLHWHIIPRWQDDSHFPQPVWGERQRPGRQREVDAAALRQNICKRLSALAENNVD